MRPQFPGNSKYKADQLTETVRIGRVSGGLVSGDSALNILVILVVLQLCCKKLYIPQHNAWLHVYLHTIIKKNQILTGRIAYFCNPLVVPNL